MTNSIVDDSYDLFQEDDDSDPDYIECRYIVSYDNPVNRDYNKMESAILALGANNIKQLSQGPKTLLVFDIALSISDRQIRRAVRTSLDRNNGSALVANVTIGGCCVWPKNNNPTSRSTTKWLRISL